MIKFKDFIKKSKKLVDTDKKTDLKRLKKRESIPSGSGTVAPDIAFVSTPEIPNDQNLIAPAQSLFRRRCPSHYPPGAACA